MRAAHLCSGLLAPMLSFDPAVQDCGEVSLSLSVSEPKSAADTFLLDMVVRDTAYSPILMPFHNKTRESVAQCKLDIFVAENVTSLRTLTNEAERTLDLPKRRSRHGTSPWLSMVVNGTVVVPFEEEEEGTGAASDVVKVQGEDPATPGLLP